MFFFYVLYLAASINTLHDKFIDIANKKFWEVKKRIESNTDINSISISELQLLWSCNKLSTEDYCLFRLGSIEVRREYVVVTMVGFIIYCGSTLVTFKNDIK